MDSLLEPFQLVTEDIPLDGWCFYNAARKYLPNLTAQEIKKYFIDSSKLKLSY